MSEEIPTPRTDDKIWKDFITQFDRDFPTLPLYDTEDCQCYVKRAVVTRTRQLERELATERKLRGECQDAIKWAKDELRCAFAKLHAAEAARDEAEKALRWQPIKTAPKDGTRVLLFIPKSDERPAYQTVGWWDKEFDQIGLTRGGNAKYRAAWTDGTVASWGYEENTELQPTYWMPLPIPPLTPTPAKEELA